MHGSAVILLGIAPSTLIAWATEPAQSYDSRPSATPLYGLVDQTLIVECSIVARAAASSATNWL